MKDVTSAAVHCERLCGHVSFSLGCPQGCMQDRQNPSLLSLGHHLNTMWVWMPQLCSVCVHLTYIIFIPGIWSSLFSRLHSEMSDRKSKIFCSLPPLDKWMSLTVCLMCQMYCMVPCCEEKSHVNQLLREGQAFMMKWHFADIKIVQFVLDVVECSCWGAVS